LKISYEIFSNKREEKENVTEHVGKTLNFKKGYLTSLCKYDIFPFVEGGCPLSLMDKTVDS